MFYIYQIVIWFILLLFLSSKIKRKNSRILFSIVASLFSTLEIVAVYMTENFLNYRFYTHMNLNAIQENGFQFVTQIVLFTILFFFMSLIIYHLSKKMNDSVLRHNKHFIPAVLASFILLSLPNGIFNKAYKIYEIVNAEEKDFNQSLEDLGISPTKYITPDKLTAKKGKNIIVISIESLEQGFLGENFDNITPNLTRLSKEWTFYNKMPQSPGGDWTAASLYSHQVGMPAFFKTPWNRSFQSTIDVKLTGLGHVLNKAGYNSKYIMGNPELSGTTELLNAYHITAISQDNTLGKYPKVENGLNDYDLFKEAKLQVQEFQKDKDRPFALFLSTINTHFPDGIYDKRMEKIISPKDNNLEFSVSAVDYLVNDFLLYLKRNNLLKSTAIYIFPDHELMGSTGPVHEKLRKSTRKIYLLTNVKENKLPRQTSHTIYQIDLPHMIIDGAEIKTNATFLVDYIKNRDINNFLKKNRIKLTTLNAASLIKVGYQKDIKINVIDNNLTLSTEDIVFNVPLLAENKIFDMTFHSNMVLSSKGWEKNFGRTFKAHQFDEEFKQLHISIFLKENKIEKVCFGNLKTNGICKYDTEVIFSKDEISTVMNNSMLSISYLYYSYPVYIVERLKNIISERL